MSWSSSFRRQSAVIVSITAGVAALTAASPSLAQESSRESASPTFSNDELMTRQIPLIEGADEIRKLVAEQNLDGFAGIAISPEEGRLTLYWKGNRPASLVNLLESLRKRFAVRVVGAAHSNQELQAEAIRIIKDPVGTLGTAVKAVAPLPDGSAVEVTTDGGEATNPPTRNAGNGIPLTWRTGRGKFASRYDDSPPPIDGGARMVNQRDRSSCTSGFGVSRWSDGATFMMSAAHCGQTTDTWKTGGGNGMGTTTSSQYTSDVSLIQVTSGYKIWDGAVNSSGHGVNEFSRRVVGWHWPTVGQYVCASGSFSGARCGIRITNDNVSLILDGDQPVGGEVSAEVGNHTNAWGNGDSGGPVFTPSGDTGAVANGIISAMDTGAGATCTGVPASATRSCSWRVYFANIQNAQNVLRADVNTG